jgi:hypothetical protein
MDRIQGAVAELVFQKNGRAAREKQVPLLRFGMTERKASARAEADSRRE